MYNIFFKALILVIILSTLCILGIKPKIHKQVLVYDSSYSIVEDDTDSIDEALLPEKNEIAYEEKTTKSVENKQVQKKDNLAKKVTADKKISQKPKIEAKKDVVQKNVAKTVSQPVKTVNVPEKKVVTKPIEIKKEASNTVVENKPAKTVITQSEEEIAWNIWRSNLQNQIMKDTKLPYVPKGTVFRFSFDVDKYGRITSIKTWSLNPNYTPYAIQYIAPVIRSYQGRDILDFPDGTQRLSTNFSGGWKISDNAKYSTPNDYNDIEKVKK